MLKGGNKNNDLKNIFNTKLSIPTFCSSRRESEFFHCRRPEFRERTVPPDEQLTTISEVVRGDDNQIRSAIARILGIVNYETSVRTNFKSLMSNVTHCCFTDTVYIQFGVCQARIGKSILILKQKES